MGRAEGNMLADPEAQIGTPAVHTVQIGGIRGAAG